MIDTKVYIAQAISDRSFSVLSNYVRMNFGINLTETKKSLVVNRLSKRMRLAGLTTIDEYCAYLFSGSGKHELNMLSDLLSTNKTYFYREPAHFHFFDQLLNSWDRSKELNVWSAASSSGDEAYTISILIQEFIERTNSFLNYNILGSDISSTMLAKAKAGLYSQQDLNELPHIYKVKYFDKDKQNSGQYKIRTKAKEKVLFQHFNLVKDLSLYKRTFDVIFCRNVLIYFDDDTKNMVIKGLLERIKLGGYLVLAHCEGMLCRNFSVNQIQPGVFQKVSE